MGGLDREGRDGPVVIARDEIVALVVPSCPARPSARLPVWVLESVSLVDWRSTCHSVLCSPIFPIVAGLASVLIFVSRVGAVESHRPWGFMRRRSTWILWKTDVNCPGVEEKSTVSPSIN